MTETRIKISSIVENQLPQFVKEEFPLVSEFLSQYYISLENQGGTNDILQNIDQYVKVDSLTNLTESTTLTSEVTFFDTEINVVSTAGFPDSYGLLLIDSEIITYTSKTSTTFEGCVRGFSGVTSYKVKDQLTFTETESQEHSSDVEVVNLSILFLKEFLTKIKKQFTPGFEDRELYPDLSQKLFIKQAIDFYSSKGTDNSFKILFKALYGQNVEVIRPRDYLIQPSDAQYRITNDLVVEAIQGDPRNLVNLTLYQDETDFVNSAQGTITDVEKLVRNSKEYYLISLDAGYDRDIQPSGSIFGKFSIHPKTKTVSNILSGSTTLEVDSTVAFPNENGNLIIDLENQTTLTVPYTSKTLNQFLGCSGIIQDIPESTEVKSDSYAYGNFGSEKITVRILGVLSELNNPENTKLYSKGDLIKIKTLGTDLKDYKSNNWFFNIPVKYDVESIELLDESDGSYKINVYDDNFIKVGDFVSLIPSGGDKIDCYVTFLNGDRSFNIQVGSRILNTNLSYSVKKNLSKVTSENYPSVNQYTSNIQNVYSDDESLYIAAPSLPTYLNQKLKINDRSISFSGSFNGTILDIGKHGFYTGDSIVYKPSANNTLGITTGIYFIKKINETQIKLSRSKNNIFTENFVSVNGTVSNAKFELVDFTYEDLSTRELESQKLIRKISEPQFKDKEYDTDPGSTGIFLNGVELLNYKSKDNVYYGPIEKIIPVAGGSDYDIINPPIMTITDPIGSGSSAYCSVIGGLSRIDIIDPGFDYLEEPRIEITGGNGSNAAAKVNLASFDHVVSFNSQSSAGSVSLNPTNTIGFSTYHKFRDAEEVIYITDGQNNISGLSTNSNYFISVQDSFTVKLHNSFSDAVVGINTIELTSYGTGNHSFKSVNKKKKIGSIIVENSGTNYQNKLLTTNASGINTASNTITIANHGYKDGEIITYNATETPIGGLSSETSYYVTTLDANQFQLSSIGVGTIGVTSSYYYDTNQYINLTSVGSGIHKFNYPEIKVSVNGRIGISTLSGQNFNSIIQPIFRGEIESVFVESGGVRYGSEEIINYNRQPLIELNSGSGISLSPIISNGTIVDVLIKSSGSNYNSPPNIEVIGEGTGAVLTPILLNGSLVEVKVIYGGIGYNSNNTSIIVTSSGSGAKFEAQIKSWKINLVERLIRSSKISEDDGILAVKPGVEYGLEYTHAYAPRQLRSLLQSTTFVDGEKTYLPDLQFDKKELTSTAHSPIIGWAYDGNPIYGPYGYSSTTGGTIKCLVSGYKNTINSDRPGGDNESLYPFGFFVDDYEYAGDGDLDEHNGRFGVTPEYPNGVYAYFTTIKNGDVESVGLFEKYKKPTFPYVIGPSYKSRPIDFNFSSNSNQDFIDINETGWKRNTTPYNLLNERSSYDYILDSNTVKSQTSIVKSAGAGSVESVKIINPGQNYKVGDNLIFSNTKNNQVSSKVSLIKGKTVSQISIASSTFEDTALYPNGGSFIGFTTVPHNFLNNDIVTFTGKYDYKKTGTIKVTNNRLVLTSGIGSAQYTGLVTFFNVSGNLTYPNIKENDIYEIGDEQVKVLGIDRKSSRIKVLRNQNNTTGLVTYTAGIGFTEKTNRFQINFGITTSYSPKVNREFYFNPVESVGLGTNAGVGIVSTIYFSNPGVGITQITIPTQSIYLPNHNLITGDSLIYSSNGGTQISVSTNGTSSFQLQDQSIVYAAKISNDLIGISTIKVGLGSTGNFVGIGSTAGSILFFTSVGTGETHNFKTNYENILTGTINKNVVTVSTAETHGLSILDNVIFNVKLGISTSVVIQYDDYNRRMIINPRSFSSIDIENNLINIKNHGYYNGQKVLYRSNTPASGLVDKNLYYIVVIDPNKIKLSDSYYGATKKDPEIVDISSSTSGTICPINSPIQVAKNQTIIFDLSDSSLSYSSNTGFAKSAFDFKIYTNDRLTEEFNSSGSSSLFNVVKTGQIGVDSTAKVTVSIDDETPNILYYTLVPIKSDLNLQIKKDLIIDTEVISSNKISIVNSDYNNKHTIVGISSTSFDFNIFSTFGLETLTSDSNDIEYYTNSISANGPIQEISIINKGKEYNELPSVISVESDTGSNAFLIPETNSIGKVNSTEIQDIGFDYSSDYSIRPTVKYPSILFLETLLSFDEIGITSSGKGYVISPSLVVIDGETNQVIPDVNLTYSNGDRYVTILKNTSNISNAIPKIIPTNNSNGIKINNIVFNNSTKDVTVTLGTSFSNPEDFPFFVGEKVLIEGTSVGIATTGKGYNSSNYNYSLFTLTGVTTSLGGSVGIVTYSLSSYLNDDEIPGDFEASNSAGRIIPESYFPIFNPTFKKNNFYEGETIYSILGNEIGVVEKWDSNNQYLKVSTTSDFEPNQKIIGKTSGSVAVINDIIIGIESDYKVDSTSLIKKGWYRETGFLNNDFQRVHDSDYYQYFSYSLRSSKDLNTWDNPVSILNHTIGFKKFGNVVIESEATNAGISTNQNQGDLVSISDLVSFASLNCVYDFDLVRENNLNIDGLLASNEITFNSEDIQDYIESIGNRVLIIDDISEEFNSNPRPTKFSTVDSFDLNRYRSKKYIAFVQDKRDSSESQLSLLSFIHNDSTAFLNQYAIIDSPNNLGFFDFNVFGTSGNLLFYPIKTKINDYYVDLFSFSISNFGAISGVGSISLGDVANVGIGTTTIPQGTSTPTTIVGIASTYRSAKVLVQIGATDSSYFEFDEISYVHDGANVYLTDYGQLVTNTITPQLSGIGTYNAYINGSFINIELIPNNATDVDYDVNSLIVSIGNTVASNTGTLTIGGSKLTSSTTSIASSISPVPNIIASFSNDDHNCCYAIISIEDKTNLNYQVSEFLSLTSGSQSYITEFGIIETNSSLGIITSGVSGSNTNIYFTPIENINTDVKVFKVDLGLTEFNSEEALNNASLNYDYGDYVGTDNDIKKEFNLTHRTSPIFQKYFDGSNSSIVNTNANTIRIPNHFFVTGEEIKYSYSGTGTENAVGIATTTIIGLGVTDKLPESLYVVKISDIDIQVAASASESLKNIPNILNLTSVGIGSTHSFTATNQNKKSLISIDNLIQSPIVSTSVTSILSENVSFFDSEVYVSGISSIFSGDFIKIDDEIMKVASVGVGSTNSISVIRPWMGTGLSTHTSSSLVTKVFGNYNIIDNIIHFAEPPYGEVPFDNPSDRSDEIDYIGISTSATFNGRIFLRSGIAESTEETYSNNYIFDDISDQFNGIQTSFTLKSNGSDVVGISTDNSIVLINSIFQGPTSNSVLGDYDLIENVGLTSITFTGTATSISYDVNTSSIPRGGIILSVGSSQGFGYQPLVSAGGTAIVSSAGTIQSISIGNSGSGYRSGIQTTINVGVKTENLESSSIQFIGTAIVSNGSIVSVAITNPGLGYTSSNPPIVVFDSPLSYNNIPLIYSSQSTVGSGTEASIDVVVGQGSSVISFEIKNLGYGYKPGEILTVSIGGTSGIQTTSSLSFSEFQIFIDKVQNDSFSAWSIGSLEVIDSIESLFNGIRTVFPILIDGDRTTIRSKKGSNIDVQASLLVFINDVLQAPGSGYVFTGGSAIAFTEAPKTGDTCKIIFYKGTGDIDTQSVDILETIKIGDLINIRGDNKSEIQDDRIVTEIISSDVLNTNLYFGPGISQNQNLLRPLTWCKQTEDLFVGGKMVGKDRIIYEPYIQPFSNIIQNIGINSSVIFVESVKAFFDSEKEYIHDGLTEKPQNKILIISQDNLVSASATAIVSTSGTISSVIISDGGIGYNTSPTISIGNPVGVGTSGRAAASTIISGGLVTSVAISTGGFGYDQLNPPMVIIESPQSKYEIISDISYEGDFGIITGVQTTSVGVASTAIVFDFFIPGNSILRDSQVVSVGIATTGISGIQTGYYFIVSNSNVGNGVTSLDSVGGVVGIGTSFIDNVYQAISVSIAQTAVAGVGITNVAKVTVSVSDFNGLSGVGFSGFYGEYSWGKIEAPIRKTPQEFTSYTNIGGISTSPIVQRFNRLRYLNYNT